MIVHLPTPRDHFSPSTGSAVMTVIDGLAGASGRAARHQVLVAAGTYADRYGSADVIEYDAGPALPRRGEQLDAVLARTGIGRPFRGREYRRAMGAVPGRSHTLLLHNAPFTAPMAPRRAAPVLYAHNDVLPGPGWAARRGATGFEGVIAVSTWLAERLEGRLPGRLRGRLASMVNGVDTAAFGYTERPERETVRILFLGRVVPDKGPDLLLAAVARAGVVGCEVRIVGSQGFALDGPLSPYEKLLRSQAAALDVTVDFVPFATRAQVPAHFGWADVVVLPARWHEPCGLTLLEAMASGAATVITESGGMPEAAGDGALVVPRNDADVLAEAIRSLVSDSAERRRLGQRARRRAEQLDWRSRAPELDGILRRWGLPDASWDSVAANPLEESDGTRPPS